MAKTLTIRDIEVSEDTVVEALKKHIGFEEKKPYPIITICNFTGCIANSERIAINITPSMRDMILRLHSTKQIVLDMNGLVCSRHLDYKLSTLYINPQERFGLIKE